jgi:Anti-sigma factor NepR
MSKRNARQAAPDVNALAPKSTVRVGTDIKARIGQQLHAMYSDVVNQGVPDRFSEILRRLDRASEAGTDGKAKMGGRMGAPNKPVRDVMLAAVPSLRAFAISLCGNVDRADELGT